MNKVSREVGTASRLRKGWVGLESRPAPIETAVAGDVKWTDLAPWRLVARRTTCGRVGACRRAIRAVRAETIAPLLSPQIE